MKFSDWLKKYKPINNHLEEHSTPQNPEMMFQTSAAELDYVKSRAEKHVWTMADAGRSTLLRAGFHSVNALAYYITQEPWETGNEQVLLSVEVECECYNAEGYEHKHANPELGTYTDYGDPNCDNCGGFGLITEYAD